MTDEDVERFVQLGKLGWELNRTGNRAAAEQAFRAQIELYRFNAEPHASLALLSSAHGDRKAALAHLHDAVMRGFTDLLRFERAEVWDPLKNHREFLRLVDVIPDLLEAERVWPRWESLYTVDTPDDLDTLMQRHADARRRIERQAPALGERYTRLWNRLFDRAAATLLEAYVVNEPDAPDFSRALDRLMAFYASDSVLRWGRLTDDPAARLAEAAAIGLERFESGPQRATALFAMALAKNGKRDGDDRLTPGAAGLIRAALREVLDDYPDSDVATNAAIGLIRTELETGRLEQAAIAYGGLADRQTLASVRADLGPDALRLGGLPEFEARTLGGRAVDTAALRVDKVTVIDFWATWCGPCIEELSTLRKIAGKHGNDVSLIGVNMDSAEAFDAAALSRWIAEQDMPGEHLYDGDGWQSELVRAFGVREIPFTVVIGPGGEVLAVDERGRRLQRSVDEAVRRVHSARAGAAD